MISLTTTHSPDELQLYILDLGGHNFQSLQDLPHIAAMITVDEDDYEERLRRGCSPC